MTETLCRASERGAAEWRHNAQQAARATSTCRFTERQNPRAPVSSVGYRSCSTRQRTAQPICNRAVLGGRWKPVVTKSVAAEKRLPRTPIWSRLGLDSTY
jgi:hypothetical protein